MEMAQVLWFFTVLMIHSFVGLPSVGAVAYNKSVCTGRSVQLFDGIQINDSDTFATLHKNGDNNIDLGRWTIGGPTFYENKHLMMDANNNIWIINVLPLDEGLYQLKYNMANGTILETTVQLYVWVAPNENCKIFVTQQGDILTVALTGKDCGKPIASVYWKNYAGATVHDEKALELQSGREAGTYFACMRGVSLSCASSSDPSAHHCRPYTVNKDQFQSSTVGSTTHLSSEGSKDPIQIADLVLQCVVLVLVLVLIISVGMYILYNHNRCCCKNVPNADQIPEGIPLNTSGEQTDQV